MLRVTGFSAKEQASLNTTSTSTSTPSSPAHLLNGASTEAAPAPSQEQPADAPSAPPYLSVDQRRKQV